MNANKQITFSENKSHSTFLCENAEYNKQFKNNNNISKLNRGSSMNQNKYNCLKLEQNNMHIILEFPKEPENKETIKKEVKEMLSDILLEYLAKDSSF